MLAKVNEQKSAAGRWQSDFLGLANSKDLRRTRLSLNRGRKSIRAGPGSRRPEELPIVAEANADDSGFPSESTFGSLHRFGDLCDRCPSLRVRFELLHVLF
jgi:hypothetical protein